jgi:hypothetical protein
MRLVGARDVTTCNSHRYSSIGSEPVRVIATFSAAMRRGAAKMGTAWPSRTAVTLAHRREPDAIVTAAQRRVGSNVRRCAGAGRGRGIPLASCTGAMLNDNAARATAERRWANYLEVGHNGLEFLLRFGQLYSDGEPPQVHSHIVTNPVYAKAMLKTLEESIEQYEEEFGSID